MSLVFRLLHNLQLPIFQKLGSIFIGLVFCLVSVCTVAEPADEVIPVDQSTVVSDSTSDSLDADSDNSSNKDSEDLSRELFDENSPFKKSTDYTDVNVGKLYISLMVLLVISIGVLWMIRKRLVSAGKLPEKVGGHMQLIDKLSLNNKTTAYYVEVDGKKVLITQTDGSVSSTVMREDS